MPSLRAEGCASHLTAPQPVRWTHCLYPMAGRCGSPGRGCLRNGGPRGVPGRWRRGGGGASPGHRFGMVRQVSGGGGRQRREASLQAPGVEVVSVGGVDVAGCRGRRPARCSPASGTAPARPQASADPRRRPRAGAPGCYSRRPPRPGRRVEAFQRHRQPEPHGDHLEGLTVTPPVIACGSAAAPLLRPISRWPGQCWRAP
jgi:hypothetical protein